MTHDKITLPVSGYNTVGDFFWTLFNTDKVLNSPTPLKSLSVSTTALMPTAQASEHDLTKLTARPKIQIRVDALMGYLHGLVHRIQLLEALCNLFRRPAFIKMLKDELS